MLLCSCSGIAQRWSPRRQVGFHLSRLRQPREAAQGELRSFPPRNVGGAARGALPSHAWVAAMLRRAVLQCLVHALRVHGKTESHLLRASSCNLSAEALISLSLRGEARRCLLL